MVQTTPCLCKAWLITQSGGTNHALLMQGVANNGTGHIVIGKDSALEEPSLITNRHGTPSDRNGLGFGNVESNKQRTPTDRLRLVVHIARRV